MLFGKHINRYYLRHAFPLFIGILSLLFVDYIQLKVPELYRMVINGINTGTVTVNGQQLAFDMNVLMQEICKPMIVVILVMVIGRFLWRFCFIGTSIKVQADLRARMFDHCKDLSQEYYQVNKVGTLMSLFTNDLETIQDCFGWGILMCTDALALGLMASLKMARMNLLLAGLSMIPLAILLVMGIILEKYLEMKWDKRQEAFSELSDFSQESFAGIAVIKAFVKETKELIAFRKLNKKNEDINVDFVRLSVLMEVAVTLLIESVICVILGFGGYLVYTGIFNAGQLIEYIGYFSSVIWPIMAVSELVQMISRGRASLDRISKLLDEDISVKDSPDVIDCVTLDGDIEFKGLTFRYPGAEHDSLTDVSLKINAGENVGIIGKVGSGKTTLVDLILRTYNVPDGTLFLDGKDVNSIPIKTVRNNAAYVPQDNFLFSDTIKNNIAFASDNDSIDNVKHASVLSDIDGNIEEFTDKYETVLGERGVTVSGGQKQRISIARAIMKDARILILDDSVSAVDVKTEKKILDNLAETRKGKTTILIAHRVTTVERMDKIVFLDDGKIVAVGSHDELLNSCEEYRCTVELQRLDDLGETKEVR